jgi:salicylate hydroxylase
MRATRLQEASRGRGDANHLPDGLGQAARDKALATAGPLAANGWIYSYDTDTAC